MYMSGHSHGGGRGYDSSGVFHLTLPSPLNCVPGESDGAHAVISVF